MSIADPLLDDPLLGGQCRVTVHRLIGAIFLGAAMEDANCLVIRPWSSEPH